MKTRKKINPYKVLRLVGILLAVAFVCYCTFNAQPDKEEAERAYYHSAEYGAMMRRQQLKEIADEKERQEIAAQYHVEEAAKFKAWQQKIEKEKAARHEAERQNFIQHRRDPRPSGVITVAE